MPPRLKKWLKRLTIAALLLVAIGVGAFTWIAYWPLEGDVDDLMTLVPYDAEFLMRANWDDLQQTGWIERNLEQSALHPALREWRDEEGAFRSRELASSSLPGLKRAVSALEEAINSQIPLSAEWATFGVEKDILRGELAIAGMWCQDRDPRQGPPAWQEILVLKRVSWRPRMALAALSHDFVRERVVAGSPDLADLSDEGDGVLKVTLRNVRVSPERERAACGRNFTMPPENEWYLRRIRDVVAVSNSRRMISRVADLTREGKASDSFAGRPGFDARLDPNGVVAVANLQPLARYLIRWIERRQDRLGVLNRFLRPNSLEKLNGGVSLAVSDLLTFGGRMSYVPQEAGDIADAMYRLPPRPVTEGIASMVPAADTFLAAFVRCDPRYLLTAVYEEAMSAEERRIWQTNLQQMRREGRTTFTTVEDLFREVASRMDDTATIAIGRLRAYDGYAQEDYFSDDQPAALPAFAILVKLREGASPDEVDSFLAEKVPLVGIDTNLERREHRGMTYTRLHVPGTLNERHLEPAYVVVSGHLVLSSSEVYLKQILDAVTGEAGTSLAQDDAFRVTMRALPERGQAALFVDIEKLTRVPPSGDPRGRPWGYLWDQRNEVVRSRHDDREIAIAVRRTEEAKYPKPLSRDAARAVNDAVTRAKERFYAQYPDFVEEYRRELETMRRFRSVGLVVAAQPTALDTQSHLELQAVVSLRDAEADIAWARRKP